MAIPFAVPIAFMELLGCELQRCDGGQAEVTLALREDQHTNSFGVAHGGVIMTLLDVAMAHAARSLHKDRPDGGPGLVTIELKTTFMRPGQGLLRAQGSVLHGSAQLAFCEGRVLDEQGQLCAHATATFKFLRALPVSGRQVRSLATADSPEPSPFTGSGSD